MPRRSSHYRDCDDDKHRHKHDCSKSCYKSKKSSRREHSDSSVSESTLSNSCYCNKCSREDKNEKPHIVICKKDESSREHTSVCDKCDKSVVIVINMN
jgi:hypothetical protein